MCYFKKQLIQFISLIGFSITPNCVFSQEIPSCSITGLENVGMNYISVYNQFNFGDRFQVNANVPVKLSLSNIGTNSEPADISRSTHAIATLMHERLLIYTMVDWATKTSSSPAVDAQNLIGSLEGYRLRGYVRQLSSPGVYSYSITINCLL